MTPPEPVTATVAKPRVKKGGEAPVNVAVTGPATVTAVGLCKGKPAIKLDSSVAPTNGAAASKVTKTVTFIT